MKKLTEQELAEIFHAVLSRSTQTVRRLRLRLREEGQRSDEVVQFRLLQRACREDSALAQSLAQAGLGPVASYRLDPPAPEVGQLIQAFIHRVEDYWDEDGLRSGGLHRSGESSSSALMPRRGEGGFSMEVHVHAGKDLVVRDLFTSDPYCVLTYEDSSYDIVQRSQTEVQRNTCDPFWKDVHHFTHVHSTGLLTIEIWDKDMRGGDDFMGKVLIPMETMDFRKEHHTWHPVTEAESGQLRVRIQFARSAA